MVRIDVLTDQRDLPDARASKPSDFLQDRADRPRDLGSARIGHDAERAEFVAAFLDGDESGRAAARDRLARARRQPRKLALGREVSVDHARSNLRLPQELRQAMIALRADDDVDRRLTAQDLGALGLGETAGHDQGRPPAGLSPFVFQFAELSEFGIDFLRGLFAYVAGVENDEVGVLDACGVRITLESGQVGHSLRIVDVHLATERLDQRPPDFASGDPRARAGHNQT